MVVLAALAAVFFKLERGVADSKPCHRVFYVGFNALHISQIANHHVSRGRVFGGADGPHVQMVDFFNAFNFADFVHQHIGVD